MKQGIFILAASSVIGIGASAAPLIAINEVYGGGGNAGASFNYDFVELYNAGTDPYDLSGAILQYASATGTTYMPIYTFGTNTFLAAGAFALIQAGTNNAAIGTPLPTPTYVGSQNLSATNGKVRLLLGATTLDLVGFGTATTFEGAAPAPAGSNTLSVSRTVDGLDTNVNSADFSALTPTPGMTNVAIPEPSTAVTLLGGMAVLGSVTRRRLLTA